MQCMQYMVAMVAMKHAIYTEHWIALICPLTGQQKLVYYVITQLIMIMQSVCDQNSCRNLLLYTLSNTESYQKTYGSIQCIAVYVNNERDNESQLSYTHACMGYTST